MWSFNRTLSQWAWLKGSTYNQVSSSAGLGIESPSNIPAARNGHTMNALTSTKAFLLFGGYACFPGPIQYSNEVWRYNITTNLWTLLSGNSASGDQAATHVTTGTPSALNSPAGMAWHAASFAYGTEKLCLFGGESSSGSIADVWMFDALLSQWIFVSSGSQAGVYVQDMCPGARNTHSFISIPKTDLFIMVRPFF